MVLNKFGILGFLVLSCSLVSQALRCSEVEYCSALRDRAPTNNYIVDTLSIHIDDIGIIRFNLLGRVGFVDLEVNIFAYKDDVLRVKIKEFDSTRFELSDAFAGAPNLAGVTSVTTDADQITITTNIGSRLVVKLAPFDLEFYRNDVLELLLNGDRLFMDDPANNPSFSVGLVFPESDHLYGLNERATDGLPLTYTDESHPYRLYNRDLPNYPINDTDSVYGSIPFIYGHGPEFTAGIFLHNAAQQFVDILPNDGQNMALFYTEAGTLDVFVFLGPTPAEVLRQYLLITGVPLMPPLWALGYHQCRWSYMSQDEVKDVVANFDNFDFQIDAIWLDIDHTDGKRYFTWDPVAYSDPIEMQQNLSATNRKLVVISDPHIKVEDGYSVYDGAKENDLFVRNADGSVFEGNCWPGLSSYIDFLNPEARAYYASRYSYENYPGSTPVLAGIWNDMNEPSVFDVPDNSMPGDCLHYRDVQHKELHNAYGMLQTIATHEGLLQRDNRTVRPFVLSRSHFAGSQRYTAVWTGDSASTWEYLEVSYPMCMTSNLVGIAFCGADVTGFNDNPDDELYQRWFQAGAWLPFFRVHSSTGTNRREPYLYPEDVQQVVRDAIRLRYKHLPVWYTLFHEHIIYKTPVIRPLLYHYTDDTNVFDISNQLLVGKDIMVRAVTEPGVTSVPVYFPGGENEFWFSLNNLVAYQGSENFVDIPVDINTIPIYYRAGSVIPRKDTLRPSSTEMLRDGYTLYLILDKNSTAHGTVYLDDTTSLFYLDYVEYNYLSIDYDGVDLTFTKIDSHANSDQFDLIVDAIVAYQITEMPAKGKPGKYIEKKHYADASGRLLKDMKFNFSRDAKLSVKLNLMA